MVPLQSNQIVEKRSTLMARQRTKCSFLMVNLIIAPLSIIYQEDGFLFFLIPIFFPIAVVKKCQLDAKRRCFNHFRLYGQYPRATNLWTTTNIGLFVLFTWQMLLEKDIAKQFVLALNSSQQIGRHGEPVENPYCQVPSVFSSPSSFSLHLGRMRPVFVDMKKILDLVALGLIQSF